MNIPFVLLQKLPQMQSADSQTGIIAGIIFGAFILFIIIAARSSGKGRGSGGKTQSTGSFKRSARKIGLERYEIKLLIDMAKRYKISNPNTFLNNSGALDSSLRKTINELDAISANETVKENRKAMYFRIKQKIERNAHTKTIYSGTRQLQTNQNIAIMPETGGRYQSKVTANLKDNIGLVIPVNTKGQQVRWQKWTKVKVFFWKKNGQGYSFLSKVVGYNPLRGISTLFIRHSNQVVQAQQRRFKRKDLEKPAYFYPVKVITTGFGKKKQKKAFVDSKNSALGTVIDLSAGGCALKSSYPLSQNTLVKIEFETSRENSISVFGKILNVRRIKPFGGIMHIRFTKVSRSHLNRINSFVYEIDKD